MPTALLDDDRYAAIARRDGAWDDRFFYAVRTTGVYCRPSCAARLALRRNVSFHPSCAAAEQAGFRACRRCRRNEPNQAARHAETVRRACRLIDEAEEVPSLAEVAHQVGVSPFHFHRVFKQVLGVTPRGYADARRAARLREGLGAAASVTQTIYDAGFNAPSRVYDGAAGRLGMTPGAYRKGGVDASIRFAVGQCTLGAILVAATVKGVCAIALGDEPDALVRELQDRFPRAELLGGDAGFEALVARVVGLVEAPGQGTDQPLDIRGTAFQQRVWQALRVIPPGATASYTQIAAEIGAPAAVRRQHAGGGDPVSPRGAIRRRAVGLPLGRRAQTGAASDGARGHDARARVVPARWRRFAASGNSVFQIAAASRRDQAAGIEQQANARPDHRHRGSPQ